MGEQPMTQETNLAPMAPQETNLAPEDSGNKVYKMLRSRLPAEVPDEVPARGGGVRDASAAGRAAGVPSAAAQRKPSPLQGDDCAREARQRRGD